MTVDESSEVLLREYLETFLGFGNSDASVWFIGPEQGGGADLNEIGERVRAWDRLGGGQLVDLREYHQEIGEERWFQPKPRIQPTWNKLIRTYVALHGRKVTKEAVRGFQASSLGAKDGDTAVVELMPLPSRSMDDWIFEPIRSIPYLKSRQDYIESLRPRRVELLRRALARANPAAVVFYGLGYVEHWEDVAGLHIPRDGNGFGLACCGATAFAVAPHPTSHGASNAEFQDLGYLIARVLK